jgi:hypothetical protein
MARDFLVVGLPSLLDVPMTAGARLSLSRHLPAAQLLGQARPAGVLVGFVLGSNKQATQQVGRLFAFGPGT